MATAFVLSGGGNLGAVQVGMLQALAARGIVPDLLVGTSAGALNAAFVAGHGPNEAALGQLATIWATLSRRAIFPVEPSRVLRSLGGLESALCSDRGMRGLVARHLRFDRLENAPIPLYVVATDFLSGEEVVLSEGDALTAVVASCAIPGVLPPVPRDGLHLVDGGLANNAALSQAVALGADRIYVLPAGYACALRTPPRTPMGAAAHALSILTHQRLVTELDDFRGQAHLVVLPPPCPIRIAPTDFRHGAELVERGRRSAVEALAVGSGRRQRPGAGIAAHRHDVTRLDVAGQNVLGRAQSSSSKTKSSSQWSPTQNRLVPTCSKPDFT